MSISRMLLLLTCALLFAHCSHLSGLHERPKELMIEKAHINKLKNFLQQLSKRHNVEDYYLLVKNRQGRTLFVQEGTLLRSQSEMVVGTASQWIATLQAMWVMKQYKINPRTPLARLYSPLEFTLPPASVGLTLEDLLQHRSLLNNHHAFCPNRPWANRHDCIQQILTGMTRPKVHSIYSPYHLFMVQTLLEQLTHKTWNQLYFEAFAPLLHQEAPLSPDEGPYYTLPIARERGRSVQAATGLVISGSDFASILLHFYAPTSPLMEDLAHTPRTPSKLLRSPFHQFGKDPIYHRGAFLEEGLSGRTYISHPGHLGFTPWIGTQDGYVAILAIFDRYQGQQKAWAITSELRPYLESLFSYADSGFYDPDDDSHFFLNRQL